MADFIQYLTLKKLIHSLGNFLNEFCSNLCKSETGYSSGYYTFILCNNLHHFPQSADTVHFSNEAYSGTNSSVSFDNVLYDNFEAEPVLMQPLDFPIDDKQPVPQVNTNKPNFKGTVKQL